ncbi:ATP-binding protein [Galbibacter sp.]|uniref:ATP-binding protein n=1 Tax=Galbibacter sp. TaxID=2918471 RepID=UPI002D084E93|nr:ATP-binding protein [Galbibacter sp.]HLV64070.1 ATP-binding protein [Galbibacter sp.]
MISGARQTGKSTFCQQLQKEGVFNGDYLTLDDPTLLSAAQKDPMGFLLDMGDNVIIDEIQRAPELFLSLKKLIDENRNRRVILTGSAEVILSPKVADSLAGRIETNNIWPFSVDEIKGKPSNFLPILLDLEKRFKSIQTPWEELIELIKRGGYPEMLHRDSDIRRIKWFNSYLDSILQKDIRSLANIEGLAQIPKILNLLGSRVGSTLNMSDISRIAGIKNTTTQRYLTLLEQVFLIVKIPAWTPDAEGQFVKSPKIFLNDTGLLCSMTNERENLLTNRTQAGHLLENFIAMEIVKQISWHPYPLKLMHFSKHKGAEVDLVIEDHRKQLYGVEIKSKASLKQEDFKGLSALAKLAGKRFKRGIVLYTGTETAGGFGENLSAVPLANLWQ